jgi:hypothetical protein
MARFRKLPLEIEAVQFQGVDQRDGNNIILLAEARPQWIQDALDSRAMMLNGPNSIGVATKEGTMTASQGDWIIRGVQGELYPCKPDIFEATYEPVEA